MILPNLRSHIDEIIFRSLGAVNGSGHEPNILIVYDTLKDIIYKQALLVPIDYGDTVRS